MLLNVGTKTPPCLAGAFLVFKSGPDTIRTYDLVLIRDAL